MTDLIHVSEKCYQEIWFSCYAAKITQHAGWNDRNGNIQKYFTGENENQCDCMKNDSCFTIHGNDQCNCDNGDVFNRQDTIQITNMVNFKNKNYFQVLTTLFWSTCFSKTCNQETSKQEFSGLVQLTGVFLSSFYYKTCLT